MTGLDHPIFFESIRFIQSQLHDTGLDPLQQNVLERLIHSSGDFGVQNLLQFSPGACEIGLEALLAGAPILTDTKMAAAAIGPMVLRTLNNPMHTLLEWAPDKAPQGSTRTAIAMERAWNELSSKYQGDCSPIVLIGSAPLALLVLLEKVFQGARAPSLIIGMPVGFIGVAESKSRLLTSGLSYISLQGSRGGAALAAAAINALLRASVQGSNE